eukprot:GDKK01001986.1.p1 GENE.GDKK01001986.1~~GDKK01001986.1.p1  ORF type:complete len:373 (-),score=39.52 GDKK01001986.1:185-1225(-)
MFDDTWIVREENDLLTTVLIDYLLHKVRLNQIDADEPDITDYHHLPDTASLSDRLRVAVEESEDLPRDFTELFDFTTFKLDTGMIPEVAAAYQKLSLKQEPLTLISPEFQTPLPPTLPATFDPTHLEPPPPALDLFDLDEHFAPEKVRLAQLTNKCTKVEDLEVYITGAADIIGVTKKLRSPRNKDPRALIDHVFRQILQYKKSNQGAAHPTGGAFSGGNNSTSDGGMTRVVRVMGGNDGSSDLTPFNNNGPWELVLQLDYASSSITGSLSLGGNSDMFDAQLVGVQGMIDRTRDVPLEWSVYVVTRDMQNLQYVFFADLSGHTLRGQCSCQAIGHNADFMYLTTH